MAVIPAEFITDHPQYGRAVLYRWVDLVSTDTGAPVIIPLRSGTIFMVYSTFVNFGSIQWDTTLDPTGILFVPVLDRDTVAPNDPIDMTENSIRVGLNCGIYLRPRKTGNINPATCYALVIVRE